MYADLEEHRDDLQDVCLRFGVRRLEAFGSATGDDFDPQRSDLDFLVEFHPCEPRAHYENYFGLLEALGRLFERQVDLVEPQTIRSPVVRRRADESRILLYAA